MYVGTFFFKCTKHSQIVCMYTHIYILCVPNDFNIPEVGAETSLPFLKEGEVMRGRTAVHPRCR